MSWLPSQKTLKQAGLISLIVSTGSVVDVAFHASLPPYYLPQGFLVWSFIMGSFWGLMVYKIFIDYFRSPSLIAVLVSFNMALLFQSAYLLQGDDWAKALFFLLVDFMLFLITAVPIFNSFRKAFEL